MNERKNSSGGVAAVMTILIAVPLLYALSTGPVIGLFARGRLSAETMQAVDRLYFPLDQACDAAPPLGRLLDHYQMLWLPTFLPPAQMPPPTQPKTP